MTVIHMVWFQKITDTHIFILIVTENWLAVTVQVVNYLFRCSDLRYWSILPSLLLFYLLSFVFVTGKHCGTAAKHTSFRSKLGCEIKHQETIGVFQICMANANSPRRSLVKAGGDLVGGPFSPCWEKQWLALEERKQNKTKQYKKLNHKNVAWAKITSLRLSLFFNAWVTKSINYLYNNHLIILSHNPCD